ncbi:MAG: hypothetical protein ACI8XC_004362 [Gammaproteobacteria bacterium]|jgi:hypothetical protein
MQPTTAPYISSAVTFSLAFWLFLGSLSTAAEAKNGFDLSNASIPTAEILQGGPPRDGIPVISDPAMISAEEAEYLEDDDRVLGIVIDGIAKAYPIRILNWHEIVNDAINDKNYAITYCPLCGTGVVFDANIEGVNSEFGVSGLLYNSDVLLYDRNTGSLWSQILSKSVSGKRVGKVLKRLPVNHTSWKVWKARHPKTLAMSLKTGFHRDYGRNPYSGYETSKSIYFAVKNRAPENYHPKEEVLGIEVSGIFKAYPFIELERGKKTNFNDTMGQVKLKLNWDSDARQLQVYKNSGEEVIGVQGFWFAWFAFHPNTLVFTGNQ